jgi:uncharacterized protein (TIGR00369 family)
MSLDMNKYNFGFDVELDFNKSFDYLIGHEFVEVSKDLVITKLTVKDSHKQPGGLVHGGVYCAMAESSCSFGANSTKKGNFVGISQNTDFIKSVRGGEIKCEAKPVNVGNTIQLWEARMYIDNTQDLCATSKVKLYNLNK